MQHVLSGAMSAVLVVCLMEGENNVMKIAQPFQAGSSRCQSHLVEQGRMEAASNPARQ